MSGLNREIKQGDIYSFGKDKIHSLSYIGVVTYADADKVADIELYKLPGFGLVAIKNLRDYIQAIKETEKQNKTKHKKDSNYTLEYYAAFALQGILAAGIITDVREVADDAIAYAEELMIKLKDRK